MNSWLELKDYPKNKDYTHFSFDFWSTIAFSNPEFKQKRAEFIRKIISKRHTIEQINLVFSDVGKAYNLEMENENLICHPQILYKRVLDGLGCHNIAIDLIEYEIAQLFTHNSPLISAGFVDFFQYISKIAVTTSITSNTAFISGKFIEQFITKQIPDISFDFMLFSDLDNCAKPNAQIFNLLQIGVANLPNNLEHYPKILHIGDDLNNDFYGARRHGIDSFLIVN